MKITKFTHACLRLEHQGGTLVIDPGIWTEPQALDGADAILLTHEHFDHVDSDRLAELGVPVYAPQGAQIPLPGVQRVRVGEKFTLAGMRIDAVGGRHAYIHGDQPQCANLGYLVEDSLYHPGDALDVPDQPVEILAVPASGPWLKLDEAIGFLAAIAPRQAFPVHDGLLNERGLGLVNNWLGRFNEGYRYLAPGESL